MWRKTPALFTFQRKSYVRIFSPKNPSLLAANTKTITSRRACSSANTEFCLRFAGRNEWSAAMSSVFSSCQDVSWGQWGLLISMWTLFWHARKLVSIAHCEHFIHEILPVIAGESGHLFRGCLDWHTFCRQMSHCPCNTVLVTSHPSFQAVDTKASDSCAV